MELKPYGDRGVLLAALEDCERASLIQRLEEDLPDVCGEFVVGYDSLLLVGVSPVDAERWLHSVDGNSKVGSASQPAPADAHIVEVIYDGADLEFVAQSCGLTVRQVIELHTAPTYTVRMMGFSPGFPYLDGLDPRLHLDRRTSPRNRIEPGTVAIGGPHAGIYSVASPGGWHLLGRTERPLFDAEAASQANPDPRHVFAFSAGDTLRFQSKEEGA